MKLAKRMLELMPEGAFTVLNKAQKLERQGKKIIHFEIGQPDFPTSPHIVAAGIEALKMGKTKYTSSLGIYKLRKALAQHISKRSGVKTTINNIAVTPGCKTAIFCALASIIDPGDEVIYPDPGFPAYKSLINFFGGKAVAIPLVEENQFSFDMAKFKKNFSGKTKAIILNSPGNPTGTLIPLEDLREIAKLVEGTKTWIVSDEIYTRILYDTNSYTSIYSLPNMKERTIIADGYSKTYSMTGWRLGYLVVPESIIEKFDNLLVNAISCTAEFTQEAGVAAILDTQRSVDKMVAEFAKRRDFVINALNKISGVSCLKPQGAFYAFINIKSYKKSSEELASYILKDAGVALLPGTAFGKHGEGYLRLSYATSMKNLQEGIRRMKLSLMKL